MELRRGRGRPTPYAFHGLFLPSIAWEMKVEGIAWHRMETEPGEVGTLFRNMRRKDVSVRQMAANLRAIIQSLDPHNDQARALCEACVDALSGEAVLSDAAADLAMTRMPGLWGSFVSGMRDEEDWPTPFMKAYVEIERLSTAADAALAAGRFAEAASLVKDTPALRRYWPDGQLELLACATTAQETLGARLHAWLQLQLSVVAERATCSRVAMEAQELCGAYATLLDGDVLAPGARWLSAAKHLAGAGTLVQLRRQLMADGTDPQALPSEATIKRWSRGSLFPQRSETLKTFIERVADRAHVRAPQVSAHQALSALVRSYGAALRLDHAAVFARLLCPDAGTYMRQAFADWCASHAAAPQG